MSRARNSSSPLLTLIAVVVAVAALHLAKEILLPIALAILISFLLTPLANRLERLGLGRIISVISVATVSFAVLGVLGWVVLSQLADLGDQLPKYRNNLIAKVKQIRPESTTIENVTETIEDVQQSMAEEDERNEREKAAEDADKERAGDKEAELREQGAADAAGSESVEDSLIDSETLWSWTGGWRPGAQAKKSERAKREPIDVRLVGMPPSPLEQIRTWLGPLVAPLTTAGIAVVLVIFILLKREDQRNRLLQLFGSSHLYATTEALTDVTDRVSRYLRMQFLINAGYGLAVGIGLSAIGVPNAVMWGVLSFSLRFLPYIGPWLSAVMPLFVSIGSSSGWGQPLMVVGWFTILELIVNNVAEPLLYGRSTGVSGVGVIVAAIFWTWIWGAIGLVLAMPITVCLVVMARYIPALRFVMVLLGDQPPMSAEERIYQRLLAGDVEEAKKLSMNFLKGSTLIELYDRVLMPALRLAERDRHAGLLHEEQERAVEETARDLVDELGEVVSGSKRVDARAAASAGSPAARARILIIPLRDEADEISGLMLAQLLQAEGFAIEMAVSEALTGELVDSVQTLKIDVALISVLPPLAPRSSRLLCQRMRDRYPRLPLIVGYWCGQCTPELQRRLCADEGETATTLTEAVNRVKAVAARPPAAEKVG